jgi:membrane dipeptidase
MKAKRYNGYKSFQYLTPGTDYRPFKLALEYTRVPATIVPVSDAEETLVQQILEEDMIVSLHEHTSVMPEDVRESNEYSRQGRERTGFEGLSLSGLDVVFENFMDGTATITSNAGWKWSDVIHDLGIRRSDFDHQDMLFVAQTVDDLYRAKRQDRIALVASFEAATPIENEIDRVDVLYGLGVRAMGITYSESNGLGSGLKEPTDGGLTTFGRKVVDRMNKLGMTIDTAHCGDRTAIEAADASAQPVLMSHVGARALWDTNRMKSDDALKAIAAGGGVIGIEAAPHTTLTAAHPNHSIESIMDHFEYVVDLVGIDHVSFGPDTLYGDHVGLHHAYAAQLSIGSTHAGPTFDEVPYVKGLENPTECFPNIIRWLVSHGYSREKIRKVAGENTLRVIKATWSR